LAGSEPPVAYRDQHLILLLADLGRGFDLGERHVLGVHDMTGREGGGVAYVHHLRALVDQPYRVGRADLGRAAAPQPKLIDHDRDPGRYETEGQPWVVGNELGQLAHWPRARGGGKGRKYSSAAQTGPVESRPNPPGWEPPAPQGRSSADNPTVRHAFSARSPRSRGPPARHSPPRPRPRRGQRKAR